MMTTAGNSSSNVINADNSDNMFTANLNICMNSINDNSHDYFSFNMHLVSNYTNNQLSTIFFSIDFLLPHKLCFKHLLSNTKISSKFLDETATFNINIIS